MPSRAEPQNLAAKGGIGELCSVQIISETSQRQKQQADLRDLLAESIIEIRAGKLDPRVANALGYLGASYLRALEVSDVESRLDALEATLRAQERAILPASPEESNHEREV